LQVLENRVMLSGGPYTLASVLSAYDSGASTIVQQGAAIADKALGQNISIPIVNETLSSALGLGRDIQTPFRTQPNASDWATVQSQLQNAGFIIQTPFTGSTDANGNLLQVSWSQTFTPSPLFTTSGQTGFNYLDKVASGGLLGAINARVQAVTFQVTFGVDVQNNQPAFYVLPSSGL